jgi:PAS domain S-box-containing protein
MPQPAPRIRGVSSPIDIGFLIGAVALIVVGWMAHRVTGQLRSEAASVEHTYEVLRVLDQMQADIERPVSDTTNIRIADELARLQSLTADNGSQQRRIDTLRVQFRGPIQTVRRLIKDMEDEEQRLLTLRRSTVDRTAARATTVIVSSTVLAVLLMAVALGLLHDDLKRRRIAEDALGESEVKYRLLMQQAADAILIVDSHAVCVEGNQRAAEIIGRPVSEIPGLPLKAFVRGNANVTGPVLPMLRYGHVTTGEFWVSRPDGSRIPVEIRATMLEDGRVQVIARDITERKEVERVKDEFVSVVSHELRTPLTSIRGALGLLAAGRLDDAPERRQRMLDLAASNTDRLIRLINDILDIERINSGGVTFEREPIDVATLVDAVVEPFRIAGEKAGVTITTDVEPVQVWADPDRLTQTLTNLVDNAIKFSPRDSTVEISVRRDGRFGLFEVRDHGRGIPVEMLDAVFDRFQQVDNSDAREKGGSGLGLAISRSIVEQHGGRIWVQSTPGDGSAFRFTIPLLTERQAPSEDGGARALVVDDDSDLVEVMRATLSARGYQVFGASRGKEAIERFDEIGADLVVLDILLPDISGLRVLRHVNSTRPETKIVVYTATYLEGAERDFIRGVGAAIVTKGRTAPEQLADEIERIVSPRVASAPKDGQTG